MKRQHVLVLLALFMALAVVLYQMTSPSGTETKSMTNTADTSIPEKDEPVEAAVQPAAPEADTNLELKEMNPVKAESKSASSEEVAEGINQKLEGARKVFQQKAAIEKARPEEVHHTPKATLDAAKRLGEIAALEAQHPGQAESFREFYLECARDEDTITVTRAQCLDKYMKASKLDAAEQKQLLREYPEEIVRLVEALQ